MFSRGESWEVFFFWAFSFCVVWGFCCKLSALNLAMVSKISFNCAGVAEESIGREKSGALIDIFGERRLVAGGVLGVWLPGVLGGDCVKLNARSISCLRLSIRSFAAEVSAGGRRRLFGVSLVLNLSIIWVRS